MNSKIYKIINDINNKVYVGKTSSSLEERFKQHISDSKRRKNEQRPLYNAMNLYGAEHFSIVLIEECDWTVESEREQYWIGYYKGYEDGYNATRGGEGKVLYNYSLIENLLKQKKTAKEVANEIGCCVDVVHKVAKQSGIKLDYENSLQKEMRESKVTVHQYDLQGNFIQTFESYSAAAKWLYENGLVKTYSSGIRAHIGEVCNGTRKTAYKYIWKKQL